MFKTGFRVRQQLENRFGAEFVTSIDSDEDIKREGTALDLLPPERLFQLAAELSHRADRAAIEQDELFPVIALRLLSGWIKSKAILHTSASRKIIDAAREHEQLFFFHLGNLLKLAKGQKLDLGAPS